jgi:hypothetical protein
MSKEITIKDSAQCPFGDGEFFTCQVRRGLECGAVHEGPFPPNCPLVEYRQIVVKYKE